MREDLLARITVDPKICGGNPASGGLVSTFRSFSMHSLKD